MHSKSSGRTALFVLLLAVLVAVGAAVYWFLAGTEARTDFVRPQAGETRAPDSEPAATERVELVQPTAALRPSKASTTTVAWPVRLELELLSASDVPVEKGVRALGSGRTARLAGSVTKGVDQAISARIAFVFGPNRGRVLESNAKGEFGAADLLPGLSIVEVSGPGIAGSTRELLLRQGAETPLHLSYGVTGSFVASVFDAENKPLAEVEAELDGHHTQSGEDGFFEFPAATPGDSVLLILSKKGFVSVRENVGVAFNRGTPRDRYKFKLLKAAELELAIAPAGEATSKAQVFLFRDGFYGPRTYPWHRVSPIELQPGRSVLLDDLPTGTVQVCAFLPGFQCAPKFSKVNLVEGVRQSLTLRLEPAASLIGRVLDDRGLPVEHARVRLESPDVSSATLTYLAQPVAFLESEVISTLPAALQLTQTDHLGRFLLSAHADAAPVRYLVAESPDRRLRASRVVRTEDTEVELRLEPIEEGDGTLEVEFPGRHQGVPVEVSINGRPLPEALIGADEPLVIEGLVEGSWRIQVSWNGAPVKVAPAEFDLRDVTRRAIQLPSEAIRGQDEETLRRAGRL